MGQDYAAQAVEVMEYLDAHYWDKSGQVYRGDLGQPKAAPIWAGGIMWSALVAATRHDARAFGGRLSKYYRGLESYWDQSAKVEGYEPFPTQGGGHDKYYDDNAWLVLGLVEAFEVTGSKRYLKRAVTALDFVLSGSDDALGGGIWWHEEHKDGTKNTCVTAPAAVGCQRVAMHSKPSVAKSLRETGRSLVEWTRTTLQNDNGLYGDRIVVATGKVHRHPLTYNTALMIRSHLGLYRATGEDADLAEAKRLGALSDWFAGPTPSVYRDAPKWSHLLIEADLELFRETGDQRLFQRAKATVDHLYGKWVHTKPTELIENASIARALWLLADTQSEAGRKFWSRSENGAH